jgi:MFS family permease
VILSRPGTLDSESGFSLFCPAMNKTMLLILVLSVSSLVYGPGAVTPALADIAKAFPDKSLQSIRMIATTPMLLVMASTLVCGQLSRVMRKKTLVLAGMFLYGVGGILPAFFGGLTFILIMRGFLAPDAGFWCLSPKA